MRDFNSGGGDIHVGGNVNINNGSQNVHLPYPQCSTEVLLNDLPFRKENIKIEQKEKVERLFWYLVGGVILLLGACTGAYIQGNTNLVALGVGALGAFTSVLSIKFMIEPNRSQRIEQQAVDEIVQILKSRRVL
ncbi:MAG: hypothetical protein WA777_01790 [Rhodanobacter sp.]